MPADFPRQLLHVTVDTSTVAKCHSWRLHAEESLYSEKALHSALVVALDYGNQKRTIGTPRKEVDSVAIYTITLAPLLHPTLSSMKQGYPYL